MHYKIALMQEGYTLKAYCKVSAQGQVAACETHTGTTIMHSGALSIIFKVTLQELQEYRTVF